MVGLSAQRLRPLTRSLRRGPHVVPYECDACTEMPIGGLFRDVDGFAREADHDLVAVGKALELLALPGRREGMGKAGLRFCAAHRGATMCHLAVIREMLQSRADAPDCNRS